MVVVVVVSSPELDSDFDSLELERSSVGVVVSGGVEIGEQCFIGVNATLRDHIKIGDRCVIGAGALMLALALTGLFLGVSVDERRSAETKLRDKQAELDRSLAAAPVQEHH